MRRFGIEIMLFALAVGQRLAGMFDDSHEQWSGCPEWRHSANFINDDNNPTYGVAIDNSDGSDYNGMHEARWEEGRVSRERRAMYFARACIFNSADLPPGIGRRLIDVGFG